MTRQHRWLRSAKPLAGRIVGFVLPNVTQQHRWVRSAKRISSLGSFCQLADMRAEKPISRGLASFCQIMRNPLDLFGGEARLPLPACGERVGVRGPKRKC